VVLLDANALLDILTADPVWSAWTQGAMMEAAPDGLAINPIIYSELAPAFREERELAAALADWPLHHLPLPYEAGWPAAQAFARYRSGGGQRSSPLPDFYIGAHAQVAGLTLLTRDAARYRTYFPKVALICPTEDSPAVG
jgi:predicted nucleic acid-binding protein